LTSQARTISQRRLDEFLAKQVLRMPHLDVIRESFVMDYGLLWGVFAWPSTIYKRGIGKSVLAIKMLLGIYRDWQHAKQYIFYSPMEFVRVFERLVDEKKRVPLAIWDDAGAWLFRGRFKNKFVVAVVEHLEVIRSHMGTMVFTATSYGKLAKGIRESLSLVDLVSIDRVVPKSDPKCRSFIESYNKSRTNYELSMEAPECFVKISKTRGYTVDSEDFEWLFYRRKMPEPLWEFRFRVELPEEVYRDYKRMRDSYVKLGMEKVKKELAELAEKAAEELEEVAKKAEGRPEPAEDELDLEELAEEWGYS